MSKRFFEDLVHAGLYAQYRPRPPIQLAKRIVQYLKEKVIMKNTSHIRNYIVSQSIQQI